jgi:invasion protein IalB
MSRSVAALLFAIALSAVNSAFGAPGDTKIPLSYGPWIKVCLPDPGAGGARVCLTSSAAQVVSEGKKVLSVSIIERPNEQRIIRVMLPLGMQLKYGTRLIVDSQPANQQPYVVCFNQGCFADYAIDEAFFQKIRNGKKLIAQAINANGAPLTLPLPLTSFDAAYRGIGRDPSTLGSDAQISLDNILYRPAAVQQADARSAELIVPWTKFCLKGKEANAKPGCFTGTDGRAESGEPIVAAVMIETDGEPKKILRVTLPVGVQLVHGTRITIDGAPDQTSPYVICFVNGCMSDYEATADMIASLKKGQTLVVHAINSNGALLDLALPLAEFAKAYDGPPTDPKVFQENQKKQQEELVFRSKEKSDQAAATNPSSVESPPSSVADRPTTIVKRVALVIGNSSYKHVRVLPNPERDAATVADALKKVGFQEVTLRINLGREQMLDALRVFAKQAEAADWAVVYYAGHGIEAAGTNYVIPIDAKLGSDRDINLETVSVDQVLNAAERAQALRLILFDACRDNPFASQMKRTMGLASRSVGRGLAQMEPDPGTLVVFAAKHGEIASDGTGTNSPFVTAFVKDIQVPGVEVRRLFDQVRDDVMEMTGRRQQPYSYGSVPGRRDFYFTMK